MNDTGAIWIFLMMANEGRPVYDGNIREKDQRAMFGRVLSSGAIHIDWNSGEVTSADECHTFIQETHTL